MSHPASPGFQRAYEVAETTYSGSLSIIASLEQALDQIIKGTDLSAEAIELLEKAQQVNEVLAELQRGIDKLNDLCRESSSNLDFTYVRPGTWLMYGAS